MIAKYAKLSTNPWNTFLILNQGDFSPIVADSSRVDLGLGRFRLILEAFGLLADLSYTSTLYISSHPGSVCNISDRCNFYCR